VIKNKEELHYFLYFDSRDKSDLGYAWLSEDPSTGTKIEGPVDEELVVRALDAIAIGEFPTDIEQEALDMHYPSHSYTLDKN